MREAKRNEIAARLRGPRLAARFAAADLHHDLRLTLLGIVLLAALLAPPVVLHTLRVGLVETWAEDLARDLRNREVVIIGENTLSPEDIALIAGWQETGFVIPEPSFFVSSQSVRRAGGTGLALDLNLRTTDAGDPVMQGVLTEPMGASEIVLSARAAHRLDIVVGAELVVLLARTPSGSSTERFAVPLVVRAILPSDRWAGTAGFLSAPTLLGFREWLTFRSDDPRLVPPIETATWQSLRIYAPRVAQATALRDRLDEFGLETRLMTDQVSRILKLENGLRSLFTIVLVLSATAFVITSFLLQWLSVIRKKRDFALMGVLGLGRSDLIIFAVVQGAAMTGCACLISLALVAGLNGPVETIVQGYLSTPTPVRKPDAAPLLAGLATAVLTGAIAGIGALNTLRPEDMSHALRGD